MTGKSRPGEHMVFVGGCPRSGTTLVQNMLDSHPDICGGPEFDRIEDIVKLRNGLRSSVNIGRIDAFLSTEEVDREVGLFIERLLLPYADNRGCKIMSEKTPGNVRVFRDLLEIFPKARFIFCIRDPRAVTASLLEVARRARERGLPAPAMASSISAAIRTIKTHNRAGFDAAKLSDRVLTVVYERLVTDPEEETKRICSFLQMPWFEEMLKPGEREHDSGKALKVLTGEEHGVWYEARTYYSNPDPHRIDQWREQLTQKQKAMITTAFSEDENLRALGYQVSEETLPMAQLASGKVRFAIFSIVEFGLSSLLAYALRVPMVTNIGARLLSRAKEVQ